MAATHAGTGTRLERRKAHTRRKLLDAARAMLADGTAHQASIQDITDAADVGFGSFYNHFSTKAELFDIAVINVLEEMGTRLDQLALEQRDPAATLAQSIRLVGRLTRRQPQVAQVMVRHGVAYLDSDRGLASRALRDIIAGVEAGRFHTPYPKLALATVAGALLGALHLSLTDPDFDDDTAYDHLAEHLLRMLGIPRAEARRLSTTALPDITG
ncbi:TetR/AcrR family transcriptional regulator [Nocardiopsis ansamitocini]|uniref:TetR-family transcriptional regulator n=1 Tax=Nocardiopsis ansamitocini TaxID=1670832 RepID=A0A9W6P9Y9_9ACTN|nr:TetR/AcrR family transcriptional regulator [Nocardiopsis ansamitocini]GLU49860.1 putative TetR-family transcriptional regulator [Nocardiopsis ansamitocini]